MSKWREFEADVLRRLDIVSEYKKLGLKTASDTPRPGGWLPCFAMGREDSNPSAAIYVGDGPGYGTYHDSGGRTSDGCNLGFFRFAAEFGPYSDWRDARKHYAKDTGVKLPKESKSDPDREPLDRIEWAPWNARMVRMWCEKKGGISVEAVVAAGGRMCRYPKDSPAPHYCLAFPAWATGDTRFEPRAWIIVDHRGLPIRFHPQHEPKEKLVLGSGSGLVGKAGLEAIEDAEVVWKVEGLTDLLAATTKWLELPVGQRGKLAIVTNANGCMDVPLDSLSAFGGTEAWVVHDCDKPGEEGAERWCRALAPLAEKVKHVRLPGEIAPSHGYDLRDYFREGNALADVLKLGRKTKERVAAAGEEETKPHQQILHALHMDVVGQVENTAQIVIYSRDLRKLSVIRDVNRFSVPDAIMALGDVCDTCLWDSRDEAPVGFYRIADVRKAIAREAAHLALAGGRYLGAGVWEINHDGVSKTVVVNAQEAAIVNGQFIRTNTPRAADRVLDFGHRKWVDFEELKPLIEEARVPAFREAAVAELRELLAKWNWVSPEAPDLLAGLVLATWVQTVWVLRPMVGICGSTDCGKTLLMDKLAGLFGELAWRDDGTTAAALRQHVRHHGTICMIDELENNRGREEFLDMLRSSTRGATKTKGTAHQQAVSYTLRHIVWTSAIELGLTRAADKNRFLVFDLNKFPGRAVFPDAEALRRLGIRLLAVALAVYRDAKARSERLKAVEVPGVPGRLADCLSVPVAMLAAARSLDVADEQALLLRLATGFTEVAGEIERDEVVLLKLMLNADLQLERGVRATILQALVPVAEGGCPDANSDEYAARAGFRQVHGRGCNIGSQSLFIHPQSVVQKGILRGTRFEGHGIDLGKILLRLEGADRSQQRLGASRPWGVAIPWETVVQHLISGGEQAAEPSIEPAHESEVEDPFPEHVNNGSFF